jgi:hypothetical protein
MAPPPSSATAPSSPLQTTSQFRLSQLASHVAPMATSTSFSADVVPQAPEDPLFGLMAAFRRDTDPNKVDLGIGAYRDNNAKPWVLPVVKRVREQSKLLQAVPAKCSANSSCRCRPTRFSATTLTSTTSTFPLPVWQTSHPLHRSSFWAATALLLERSGLAYSSTVES